jgi:2-oxoglutarate ferredoxin oxidoreductase subunit alpha
MRTELNIMVGGEAGQGVQSVGFLLAKSLARAGFQVFADQDYESRVRGGHNFFRVRLSTNPVNAISKQLDILIALNQESIDLHQDELKTDGILVYDSGKFKTAGIRSSSIGIPFSDTVKAVGLNPITANTIALGVVLSLLGVNQELSRGTLQINFGQGQSLDENIQALVTGYRLAADKPRFEIERPPANKPQMLINGNEAIALGALAAGCRFVAAYPMTPVTSIMEYLTDKGRHYGMLVIQPEDEIAAINMALGASFAGARAMTATSGGGFCLMVEGLSLSGMTETPLVVIMGQRPGPAIGLPTRTEQGELGFVINAGHGEFPRAVFAPSNPHDAFSLTVKAFNLADLYQLPAIILTDHHLASSYFTVEPFDIPALRINRGKLFVPSQAADVTAFQRHAFTPEGISPRAFPLQYPGIIVATDSDEHDEAGHLIEDAPTRIRMMNKRLGKSAKMAAEISPPRCFGSDEPEVTLIGWGSVEGAVNEGVAMLNRDGIKASGIIFTELWPFPAADAERVLKSAGRTVLVENNATAQLGNLIRSQTGIKLDQNVLRFDGRPFIPEEIVQQVKGGLR